MRSRAPNVLDYSFAIFAEERTYMARQPGTYATFDTSMGKIVCRLFDKEAPNTIKNFTDLAQGKRDWSDNVSGKKGPGPLYNGTILHRVIPNFMIQGGDPSGTGMGGPGYKFADETKGSPHKFDKPGKLAMANSGPNTNGSQFFITVAATPWLTGNHTIFGEVVEGQDVVDAITKVKRNAQDRPAQDIKVNGISIDTVQ
jgi:peptidyl-prolyl cis-trans isomerase A (cyclophilin A)